MNLPAGVTMRQDVEVAPKTQPISTEGLAALAAQKRREIEDMEAAIARRQQAEQDELARIRAEGEARAQAQEKKRQEAEQERQKWAAINAQVMPSGWLERGAGLEFEQVVVSAHPVVPMLVGDDLVIRDLGLDLEVFELVSPIVPQGSADMLLALYQAEASRRWHRLLSAAQDLLGAGPWLYTSSLPVAELVDAGPVQPQTDRPSHTHKIVRATWGDCYIHNPHKGA